VDIDTTPFFVTEVTCDAAVLEHLTTDPIMANLIDRFGDYQWRCHTVFFTVVRAVVGQSISTKAATTIFTRLVTATSLDAKVIATMPEADLRALGLSQQKARAIQALAQLELEGQFDDIDAQTLVERIIPIRGIGIWTAEMVAIFSLGALDVWALADLATVVAGRDLYGVTGKKALRELGDRFSPYRSVALWYFWRWMEAGQPTVNIGDARA
jgi:DNA-3-methyladenine glycosylase II